MPTWLPTRKAKSLYRVGTFFADVVFSGTSKVQTIKIKPGKILYTQTMRAYYYFKEFQRYF